MLSSCSCNSNTDGCISITLNRASVAIRPNIIGSSTSCCSCLHTSPVRVVAKYCDEHVCLSACLSPSISPEPNVHVAYGHGSVLFWQGGEIPRGKGNLGVFVPIDSAL